MAREESLVTVTEIANATLATKQFYFVKLNSSAKAILAGDGERAYGVLQDKPDAADKACSVAIHGISKVVAGAAITAGAAVTSDANGKAVTAGTGDIVNGIAAEQATAEDQVISVRLV